MAVRVLPRWSVAALVALSLRNAAAAHDAPDYCDHGTLSDVRRQRLDLLTRYQPRAKPGVNRCEGAFSIKHAAAKLQLASASYACRIPKSTQPQPAALELLWPTPPREKEVHLRIRSGGGAAYLLDTQTASGAFKWPTDVLSMLGVSRSSLLPLAWMADANDANAAKRRYLPVRWSDARVEDCTKYMLVFDGVANAKRVVLSFTPITPTGATTTIPIENPYNGPRARVPFAWKDLKNGPGLYEVVADFQGSGAARFLMWHLPLT